MSENFQKFSYSEKQYILKVIAFLDSLIVKSDFDASLTETVESKIAGELYVLAQNKRDTIFNYKVTMDDLIAQHVSVDMLQLFKSNQGDFLAKLPIPLEESLTEKYRAQTIANYVEKNPYYLILNGEPASDKEIILVEDIFEGGNYPIHMYSEAFHPKMYAHLMNYNQEVFNQIVEENKKIGRDYEYLSHITCKVPYHIAREAKNFEILWSNKSILSDRDNHNFYTSYYNARDYVLTVPYIRNYAETEELYDRWMGIVVLFIASLNFIANRLDIYLRNEYATNEDRRKFFAEYNMEELVDKLSESQLNSLITNMDQLIALKGSDEVIVKILDLFGIKDIDIYKYALLKTVNSDPISKDIIIDPAKPRSDNYKLSLVKIPIEGEDTSRTNSRYISDKSQHTDFRSIALRDKYFLGSHLSTSDVGSNPKLKMIEDIEDRLKNNEEFSYWYTKYLGILTHVNITQSLIEATYLFQTVMHDNETLDNKVAFSSVAEPVTIRHLFAAINYVTTLRSGMSDDIIISTEGIASIMGFNVNPNLEELRNMSQFVIPNQDTPDDEMYDLRLPKIINEDEIFIVRTPGTMVGDNDYIDNKFTSVASYKYNMLKHDELLDKMYRSTDYQEYMGYLKIFNYNMYCKANIDLFEGATNYSTYIQSSVPELYEYIMNYLNAQTDSIWEDDEGEYTTAFIEACVNLVAEFVDAILMSLDVSQELQNAISSTYKDNTSTFSKIFTVINLFKHYTTSFCNTDTVYTINNKKDCIVKVLDFMTKEKYHDRYNEPLYELINYMWELTETVPTETTLKIREFLDEITVTDIPNPISIQDTIDIICNEKLEHILNIKYYLDETTQTELSDTVQVRDWIKTLLVIELNRASHLNIADSVEELYPLMNTGVSNVGITDELEEIV